MKVIVIFVLALLICSIQSCKVEEDFGANTVPAAKFSIKPESGPALAVFTFNAAGCEDKEDSPGLLQIRWDWENNGQWDTDWATEKITTRQYNQEGTYNITLEVKDTEGLTNSVTRQLMVTPANTPILLTSEAYAIQQNSALCDGTVSDDGGFDITAKGFCWSLEEYPEIAGAHSDDGTGQESYNGTLSGLAPNTSYFVRAYATNSNGTGYGNQKTLTTQSAEFGDPCEGTLTVTYEGQIYHTTQIGSQCWFRENLNIGERIDGELDQTDNEILEKYCYWDEPAFCDTFGAIYQWDEMMQFSLTEGSRGICPDGWHIPSKDEWSTLIEFCRGEAQAGYILKDRGTTFWFKSNVNASDLYGFTALGAGIHSRYVPHERPFCCRRTLVNFWSSSQVNDTDAFDYKLDYDSSGVIEGYRPHLEGDYVRCIKD